jgi:hypothetical protein
MRPFASQSARWLIAAVLLASGESGLESRGAEPPQERPDIRIFVGTSPPVPKSEAVLALDMDARRIGFSSGDSVLGEVELDATPANYWRLFPGAGDTPDRVVFEVRRGALLIRGDVLLEPYDRAVVDVVSAARRIRYLLTPGCTCLACLFPSLPNPDAETSSIGLGAPDTSTDGTDVGILNDEPKYYFIGITQDKDSEKNDDIVAMLKKFSNWKDLKQTTYTAAAGAVDKTAPIWLADALEGSKIAKLLDDFKAGHTITKNDVFILYFAGHTVHAADTDGDEGPADDKMLVHRLGEVSGDEVLGGESGVRDDDLATKLQGIGADDADGVGTLRIVILDTCGARGFGTGTRDLLDNVKNVVFMWSIDADKVDREARWHAALKAVTGIDKVDKGAEQDGVREPAGNNQVNFHELAQHSRPDEGLSNSGMLPEVYRRPVLKK